MVAAVITGGVLWAEMSIAYLNGILFFDETLVISTLAFALDVIFKAVTTLGHVIMRVTILAL
jgi:hypothetical protein